MANTKGQINLNKLSNSTINEQSNTPVGAYYLANNPQYYEPQRSNNFTFFVGEEDMKQILDKFGLTTDSDSMHALQLAVKSSSVPHFDIEKLTINRGNSQIHFAGKPTFKDGSITVHDYIGAHTKEILLAWQRLAYDVTTEKIGLAKDYKKTAYLLEYTPDYQLVRTWVLEGCWVSSITEQNYDHDSNDLRTMDVTIIYDKGYIDLSDNENA